MTFQFEDMTYGENHTFIININLIVVDIILDLTRKVKDLFLADFIEPIDMID